MRYAILSRPLSHGTTAHKTTAFQGGLTLQFRRQIYSRTFYHFLYSLGRAALRRQFRDGAQQFFLLFFYRQRKLLSPSRRQANKKMAARSNILSLGAVMPLFFNFSISKKKFSRLSDFHKIYYFFVIC